MNARSWSCEKLPSTRIAPAIALLEAEGYRVGTSGVGTYDSEEEPMWRDGTYIKDLVVREDPARPVIERLNAMLTPNRPLKPWPPSEEG